MGVEELWLSFPAIAASQKLGPKNFITLFRSKELGTCLPFPSHQAAIELLATSVFRNY